LNILILTISIGSAQSFPEESLPPLEINTINPLYAMIEPKTESSIDIIYMSQKKKRENKRRAKNMSSMRDPDKN